MACLTYNFIMDLVKCSGFIMDLVKCSGFYRSGVEVSSGWTEQVIERGAFCFVYRVSQV